MGGAGTKEVDGKPVVLVVGGGYGGAAAARALDETGNFNVVMIDRKDYFVHNVAALRAAVDKAWGPRIVIPYTKLLRNGTVVHGEVTEAGPKGVLVHGREEPIAFDYLLLATGSSYAFPGKIAVPTREEALQKYAEMADIIASVKRVLIVGGGPVGCELAGEIVESHPNVKVTLVHSQGELINSNLSNKLMQQVQEQLEARGVKLVLGERVDLGQKGLKDEVGSSNNYFIAGKRKVMTDKGTEIKTDLIFICTGIITNNKSFQTHFSDALDSAGRLQVNQCFQVDGHDNIFALGDCCNMEAKMAYYAGLHAKVVAKNIQILEANKNSNKQKPLVSYTPGAYPGMFISIGSTAGVGQLPMKGERVFGARVTSMLKSKTLFTAKSWSLNHQKLRWDDPQPDTLLVAEGVRRKNLAAALGVSEEDAGSLLQPSSLPGVEREAGEVHT